MSDALVQSATIQLKAQAGGGFGSVPDGSPTDQITLTGSGFGASGAQVTFIDEYDYALADGALIPDGVGTPYRDNSIPSNNPMTFDSTSALVGRSGSMRGNTKCQIMPQVNRSDEIYVSWFQAWDVDLEDPAVFTTNARSDKVLRVWDNDQVGNTRISWTKQHITYEDPLGSSPNYNAFIQNAGLVDVYQRFELWAKKGVGIKIWQNGVLKVSTTDFGDNFPADGLYPELFGYDMADVGHILQSFTTNVAEAAALDGYARVEFSNTASWGASGAFKRYRQTHSFWSDGSITIDEPFFGDLVTTQGSVYAHVVLSDGTVYDVGVVV